MTSAVPSSKQRRKEGEETGGDDDPVYRDFSRVTSTEDSAIQSLIAIGASSTVPTHGKPSSSSSDRNFPVRLHYILSELEADGLSHIVAWQPHGRCFIVHKQQEFVDLVLRRWFRQTQLASFQRQLNIYGFNRITFGPDKNAYYHECFLRGKLFLAQSIKRTKVKGKGPRRPGCHRTEPNFYAMPFLPPSNGLGLCNRESSPPELQRQLISQGMQSNNISAFLSCEQQQQPTTMNRFSLGSLAREGHSLMINGLGSLHNPSLLQHMMMTSSRFAAAPSAASNFVLPQQQAAPYPLQAMQQHQPFVQNSSAGSDRGGRNDLASFAGKRPSPRQEEEDGRSSLADDALAVSQQRQQSQQQGRHCDERSLPPHELARAIMLESIAARCREAQSISAAAVAVGRDLYHNTADGQSLLNQLRNEEIQRILEDAMRNTIHHRQN